MRCKKIILNRREAIKWPPVGVACVAVLVFFFIGLPCGALAPKAEAVFFTEVPERNQVVPLSPMMNPQYAATAEKAERENISFEEARKKEREVQQVKGAVIGFIILFVILGAIQIIPSCVRGLGKGIIAIDDARQKIRKVSLRGIGEKLAGGNNH